MDLRHRVRRPAAILLLAALLLVPVALSGHTHVGQGAHPCSICAVTHHAPIVNTPAPPDLVRPFVGLLSAPGVALAPVRSDQTPHAGRAPPAPLVTVPA